MTGRGKRRGRPPKTPAPNEKKYHLLKKPKYLQDSRLSTPSASRASTPQDSEESSRKSFSRDNTAKKRGRPPLKNKRGAGASSSYASRRSYNSPTYNKTDYHYGSDFGDSTTDKSDDEIAMSQSESQESFNNDSDSDFSLSSYSNVGPSQTRSVTPEPVWLKDDIEIPPLELPKSSDDLLVPKKYLLRSLGIYEVLRRYRNLVRLSPFRAEDFCAALISEEQSALLTEIHIALIKAILREEDSQQTHFGPLDQKDSINISLYLLDTVTWPEVLRIYVESDSSFSREVLDILSTKEYPYTPIDDRLTVLQFLADQFLTTTFVRDDMIQEGPIHYDDHCRVCHRLGNLLCCETCPAVYHLECVDPPLEDVPTEDWQCNICKSHCVSGVNDCISTKEKQGSLCRHEHFGFDRHARKYWFVCRRLFVETEDGSETWYYTTEAQFENLFNKLDPNELEKQLCKEIQEYKDEIVKQMQLTESLTNENKGSKKSYLEIENERISKESNKTDLENGTADGAVEINEQAVDIEQNLEATEIDKNDQTHLTRSRTNQISNGTFYFKLGMENSHKEYTNQYTINPLALNKPQKNEERDKKRHLSHKFSLTDASNFKWNGLLNGTEHSLLTVFKQTLLSFESSICASFMHCNWPKLRKLWLNAIGSATTAQDFQKILIVLQTSFKNVIYANVWHEQLGHIHLYRITSTEREERKKIEKREKREESEEERNRLAYNYVKYSLGLRHQVWKQKGEEYRIHGQYGWLWSSRSRRRQYWNEMQTNRIHSVNVLIKQDEKQKIMTLKRQAFDHLNFALDYASNKNLDSENNEEETENDPLKIKKENFEAIKSIVLDNVTDKSSYEQIDVSEALKTKTRIVYPKIGKKSTLDDLLERREKLRDMELKIKDSSENNSDNIPENIIPVPDNIARKKSSGNTICILKMIQDITDNKTRLNQRSKNIDIIEKCMKIHALQTELKKIQGMQKIHRCFSEQCRNSKDISIVLKLPGSSTKCFSSLCLKESLLKDEISSLIQQLKDKFLGVGKKGILHQKLAEAKNNDLLDILNKYHLGDFMTDEYFQYDIKKCLDDIATSFHECIDYDPNLMLSYCTKSEVKMENDESPEPQIIKDENNVEMKPPKVEPNEHVKQPNRRFLALPKVRKEVEIPKELDADGKERIFSASSTAGKIYLKKAEKIPATPTLVNNTEIGGVISKYPAISTFTTVKNSKNILILPRYELIKVARRAGKYYSNILNHQAKNNNSVWPYPCSRPFFRTCWIYRTFCVNSFSALGLQLRILWTCLRWDDMQTKPLTMDGKNQVTSETEIVTTELLKHRNIGLFMEITQYFRRRVVIPLELPKTIREVTSIRSGLRKRKRAESPQQTDPQVNEEWIDEDKLELWEIKQYGERQERINIIPTTRTTTGKLPLPRQLDLPDSTSPRPNRASSTEIKEKMEQQLKQQREAHNKKRAEEQKSQPQYKTFIRKILVRNADGTTKIISETVTQPINQPAPTVTPQVNTPSKPDQPQKIQVMRTADGKMSVRGLQPNQKLVQTSDGKYLILPSNSNVVGGKVTQTIQARPIATSTPTSSPVQQPPQKVLIRSVPSKTIISSNNVVKIAPETKEIVSTTPTISTSTATITQQSPSVQKIITSTGQIITQQVQGNVISSANLQQLLQQRPGQKILIQQTPTGVQKLLVASPSQTQMQSTGEKRIIIQNAAGQQQQIILQPNQNSVPQQQQLVTIGGQKLILQSSAQPSQVQQIKTITSPVQQNIQFQIQDNSSQQQQGQQQIVTVQTNGNNIAQQLVQGKIQVMNLNGQQVLVKNVGSNQVVVGQVKTSTSQAQLTPVKQTIVAASPNQQVVKTVQMQSIVNTNEATSSTAVTSSTSNEHAALLANHPPGTIIKCVTASVMQTPNGPRIVLQGLQGTEFSQQQSLIVQQQVKQQLMKAQESSGKSGASIGPTKIYLAITPQATSSQPPPLTPVQNQNNDESVAANETVGADAEKGDADEKSDQFIVTQEYIQDTIKNALRQGNLNPEIEEKLLTLQRYQEKQAKGEPFDPTSFATTYPTRGTGRVKTNVAYDSPQDSDDSESFSDNSESPKGSARRRGGNLEDDDDEWVLDAPRKYIKKADRERLERSIKKEPVDVNKKIVQEKETKIIVKTSDSGQIRKNIIFCNRMDSDNVQNNFSLSSGNDGSETEKSPEKALIASKLKMKAASQKVGVTDDQFRHHKLQVIHIGC
ncbi:hypothetical protein ACKWTF_009771 [Chironomus riparius]